MPRLAVQLVLHDVNQFFWCLHVCVCVLCVVWSFVSFLGLCIYNICCLYIYIHCTYDIIHNISRLLTST